MEKSELDEITAYLDGRYVKRADCDDRHTKVTDSISVTDKKLAVIEYQQKINNWLTAAIAGGIVALVIKVFLGG